MARNESGGEVAGLETTDQPDMGDQALIDDMLARTPHERLACLEETLRSLEALLAATGFAAATE